MTPAPGGTGTVGAPAAACPAGTGADLTVTVKRKNDGAQAPLAPVHIRKTQTRNERTGPMPTASPALFCGIKPGPYKVNGESQDGIPTDTKDVVVTSGQPNQVTLEFTRPVTPKIDPLQQITYVAGSNAPRSPITLSLTEPTFPFDGEGLLTRSNERVRVFTAAAAGTELTFNGTDNLFPGARLRGSGVQLFLEGVSPSRSLNDTTLQLKLKDGPSWKASKQPATAIVTVAGVRIVRVDRTPTVAVHPRRLYKSGPGVTDVDQEILAELELVPTGVPVAPGTMPVFRVDWSFTAHADNAPKANGGKDDTDVHFRAAAGFVASGNLKTEANTRSNATGETRIVFRASVTAGDRFRLRARVLRNPANPAAGELSHGDSPLFEIWKRLDYNNLYWMKTGGNEGVDVDTLCSEANIQPAYTPTFTEYHKGASNVIAYREFVSNLLAPTAAQLPINQLVRVRSDGADVRAVTITGLVVAADGSTSSGNEVLSLAGTVNVVGVKRFQKITRATVAANRDRSITLEDAAGGPIGTIAKNQASIILNKLFDTDVGVQAKAQLWFDANDGQIARDLEALRVSISAAGYHLVGCAYIHPKWDGRPTGRTHYYSGYPSVKLIYGSAPNTIQFHPDLEWPDNPGVNWGLMSCIFLNAGTGATAKIVARHEIGHASDHQPFGTGADPEHCPHTTCLMYFAVAGNQFCTINPDHSRRRVMGWIR